MVQHEFAILPLNPSSEERFDSYEAGKYDCISLDDASIEEILVELQELDCYWHSLKVPEKGLAYWGITLIPARSMDALMRVLAAQKKDEFIPLLGLVQEAKRQNRFIIHFSI